MKIDCINELIRIQNGEKTFCDEWLEESQGLVLYGAGKLGKLAVNVLRKVELFPDYIVDKNSVGELEGINIISPLEIPEKDKENKLFLICISTVSYEEVCLYLKQVGIKKIVQFYTYAAYKAPDVLGNGWMVSKKEFDLKKALEICELLSPCNMSVAHYLQFLNWKLNNKEIVYENYAVLNGKKYFMCPIMPHLTEKERFLDCGCYQGAIIDSFIQETSEKYEKIYAIEPDKNSIQIAQSKYRDKRIIFDDCGLSCTSIKESTFLSGMGYASRISKDGNELIRVKTIDELDYCPTIIKIHAEGEELNILKGAMGKIKQIRPIIMVLADHSEDGIYSIPKFATNFENYSYYFCLHDYCGNSAVYYFIPKERED